MFGTIKNFLKSMLSEDFGSVSFTRVTTLATMGTILLVWIFKNLTSPTFVDFGEQSGYIILFCLGAKVASKFIEVAGQVKETEANAAKSKTDEE